MGEYADLLLDGDACQVCGTWLGSSDGYPRTCADCKRDEKRHQPHPFTRCPQCNKKVKRVGLSAHMAAKHGEPTSGS